MIHDLIAGSTSSSFRSILAEYQHYFILLSLPRRSIGALVICIFRIKISFAQRHKRSKMVDEINSDWIGEFERLNLIVRQLMMKCQRTTLDDSEQ